MKKLYIIGINLLLALPLQAQETNSSRAYEIVNDDQNSRRASISIGQPIPQAMQIQTKVDQPLYSLSFPQITNNWAYETNSLATHVLDMQAKFESIPQYGLQTAASEYMQCKNSIIQGSLSQYKMKTLSEVEIDVFKNMNQQEWLQSFDKAQFQGTNEVFGLYSLYQIEGFRNIIKSLSGYDQAIIDLSNRLNRNHRSFDKNLYEQLYNMQGHEYAHINFNPFGKPEDPQ